MVSHSEQPSWPPSGTKLDALISSYPGIVDGKLVRPKKKGSPTFRWRHPPNSPVPHGLEGFSIEIALVLLIYDIEMGQDQVPGAHFSEQHLGPHREYRSLLQSLLEDPAFQSSPRVRGQIERFLGAMDLFEQDLETALAVRTKAYKARVEKRFGLLGTKGAKPLVTRLLFSTLSRWSNLSKLNRIRHVICMLEHFGIERRGREDRAYARVHKRINRPGERSARQLKGIEELGPTIGRVLLGVTVPPRKGQS